MWRDGQHNPFSTIILFLSLYFLSFLIGLFAIKSRLLVSRKNRKEKQTTKVSRIATFFLPFEVLQKSGIPFQRWKLRMIQRSRLHSFHHCPETRGAHSKCSTLLPTLPDPPTRRFGHNPPGKAGQSRVGLLNERVLPSYPRSQVAPPTRSPHGWHSRSLPRHLRCPSPRSPYPPRSTFRTTPARNRRGRPSCPAKWTMPRSGRRSGD